MSGSEEITPGQQQDFVDAIEGLRGLLGEPSITVLDHQPEEALALPDGETFFDTPGFAHLFPSSETVTKRERPFNVGDIGSVALNVIIEETDSIYTGAETRQAHSTEWSAIISAEIEAIGEI